MSGPAGDPGGRMEEPATASQPAALEIPSGLDATLVLVRHGETDFIVEGRFQGQADAELTALGKRQAELVAERLLRRTDPPPLPVPTGPPLTIVHSPLRRTSQVAGTIASILAQAEVDPHERGDGKDGAPTLQPEPGIVEIGQGEWEGLLSSEIAERYPEILAAWRREPARANAPGGERLVDVQRRVRRAMTDLLARLSAEGTPGTLDRSPILGYRGGQPSEVPWAILVGHDGVFKIVLLTLLDLPLERFWTFPFALAGLSVVEIRGGRAMLRAHNLTDHLAPLAAERALRETEERQRSGAL